jgi:hypothetical protein
VAVADLGEEPFCVPRDASSSQLNPSASTRVERRSFFPAHNNLTALRVDFLHIVRAGGCNAEAVSLTDSVAVGSLMFAHLCPLQGQDVSFLRCFPPPFPPGRNGSPLPAGSRSPGSRALKKWAVSSRTASRFACFLVIGRGAKVFSQDGAGRDDEGNNSVLCRDRYLATTPRLRQS